MAQIAKNIKKQRVSSGMTQEELAERLYVTRQTISNYENGKSNPDIETLRQMAQVLDTDMEFFLYGEQKPKDKKEIIKTSAILGAMILFLFVTPLIEEYERKQMYETFASPVFTYFMRLIGLPVLLVFTGIYAAKLIVLLAGGTPPRFRAQKTVHYVALFSSIAYVVIMFPMLPFYVHSKLAYYINRLGPIGKAFMDCTEILGKIQTPIMLFIFRFPIVYVLFVIIGGLLYLSASPKVPPKDKTPASRKATPTPISFG